MDIRQLVTNCLTGDQSAMLELVELYRSRVFGLCYRMLGQVQDAEDAAQETFVRVLKNLSRWDSSRAFEPWLLAIAGNRCRTAISKRMKRPASQPLVEPIEDGRTETQAFRHLAEEVQVALQELRPEYRQAFVLFHEHEMSYLEIAAAMECPLGTVKTWVHRARRELIACLQRRQVVEERRCAV